MDVTNTEPDDTAGDLPASWVDLAPADFDSQLPMVQGTLFPEPDRLGTPALFGGTYGEDLLQ